MQRWVGHLVPVGRAVSICRSLLQRDLCMGWVDTWSPQDVPTLHQHIDFVACLGGDGVILHASSLFKKAIPPVVSFKLG